MAVRTREELLAAMKGRMGETPTDDDITLIEDISDTLNDYEVRYANETDWKSKYEENDREWRDKYTSRFFESREETATVEEPKEEVVKKTTYEELFSEE